MPDQTKNKKIKLLLIITKGNFGGAQRYVYDLSRNLPKDSYDIKVVLGEGEKLEKKLEETQITVIKIDSLKRDVNLISDVLSFITLIKLFKKERPDVIHLNSSKIGGLGALAGRLTRIPKIIFTGHGWAFNEQRNFLSKKIIGLIHWLTIILCHHAIVVSQKTKNDVSHYPWVKNKITVIYNGVDSEILKDRSMARKELTEHYPILNKVNSDSALWLGSIAELHTNKGLDIAIKAMMAVTHQYSKPIYVILGEGGERLTLEKLIRQLNLNNKVFLLGFVPEAKNYLKACDIFLLPSRTEAYPYALLEAGSAGLPIIASNVGGIPEIIEHEKSGLLVSPENPDALAKEINNLLKNRTLLTKYGSELKEKITRDFSISEMVKKTEVLYEKSN